MKDPITPPIVVPIIPKNKPKKLILIILAKLIHLNKIYSLKHILLKKKNKTIIQYAIIALFILIIIIFTFNFTFYDLDFSY